MLVREILNEVQLLFLKFQVNIDSDPVRDRRGVIEEEKFYNLHSDRQQVDPAPWIPGPLPPEDDPTTKISITNDAKQALPLYQTTERVTDRPTGRGARASNENWIKLPFPGHDSNSGDILTPPQPSGELINSRMPRVNFVTQNKALEASESRNDKESIQRATRTDEIRTEFVRPEEERGKYKPVYPRQAIYYPEDTRRPFYDERYYPIADEMYRRDPLYENYDRRRYFPVMDPVNGPRVDRYDEPYDNYIPRKPKRIIYYAHLPEVVRTPPSVDLRYRYSVDPYRPDDIYSRNGRYDYRFRNRYPYSPLRKEERNYRDLLPAGTAVKDKKIEDKVTPTPILPQKEDKTRNTLVNNPNRNANRNLINSHQYHDSSDTYSNIPQKSFQDTVRPDEGYLRYDDPMFQTAVDDHYQRKY